MISSLALSKTQLQQLRGYAQREIHAAKGFQRNHNSVTAPERNRSTRRIVWHPRNRSRGYSATRLQSGGYAKTLVTQGFHRCVTVVTDVTAKNNDAGVAGFEGGAR
jgi:hypothetical protein